MLIDEAEVMTISKGIAKSVSPACDAAMNSLWQSGCEFIAKTFQIMNLAKPAGLMLKVGK
jgi:hypothetical protein